MLTVSSGFWIIVNIDWIFQMNEMKWRIFNYCVIGIFRCVRFICTDVICAILLFIFCILESEILQLGTITFFLNCVIKQSMDLNVKSIQKVVRSLRETNKKCCGKRWSCDFVQWPTITLHYSDAENFNSNGDNSVEIFFNLLIFLLD